MNASIAQLSQMGAGLQGVSTGLNASSQIVQGVSQRNQARFQAEIAERNADLARQRTTVQRERLAREQRRRMGTARAVAASRGVTMEGSALAFLADQAAEAAEEQALLQFGGDVRALQHEMRADVARETGRESLIGGLGGAGASLLGGLGQAALTAPRTNPRQP